MSRKQLIWNQAVKPRPDPTESLDPSFQVISHLNTGEACFISLSTDDGLVGQGGETYHILHIVFYDYDKKRGTDRMMNRFSPREYHFVLEENHPYRSDFIIRKVTPRGRPRGRENRTTTVTETHVEKFYLTAEDRKQELIFPPELRWLTDPANYNDLPEEIILILEVLAGQQLIGHAQE